MSDPVTSGEPSGASAATAGSAATAATSGNSAPIGSFGTAKGSGLLRGKRPTPPAASAATSNAGNGYQPSTIEVLRPQSEYKNPFTGETSVASPVSPEPVAQTRPEPVERAIINEPSALATSETQGRSTPAPSTVDVTEAPAAIPARERPPVVAPTKDVTPAPTAVAGELFPLELSNRERKPTPTKAELNILPTEEVKRPAVSWGEQNQNQNSEPRARRDERPTFRPERRDGREARPFEPREPRREPAAGDRNSYPRDQQRDQPRDPRDQPRDPRDQPRDFRRDERPAPVEAPKKSGGFFGWLKNLFAEKPAVQPEVRTGDRDDFRDGGQRHNRRRHRGGRGRGGYNGDQGSRDYQPRDPRDEQGPSSQDGGQSGENRYEGGGRRRHRGGRGRNRDDRGGPRPEGQQGGGAI